MIFEDVYCIINDILYILDEKSMGYIYFFYVSCFLFSTQTLVDHLVLDKKSYTKIRANR